MEEVESAEAKMNEAKNTLLKYVEQRESIDRDRHTRLVARLKKAQAEFLKALSELDQ
jgi:hypothetical protein